MRKPILEQAAQAMHTNRRRKRWHRVVTVLSALVVFVTTYLLILPAITLEQAAYCGQAEHTHTDSCYAQESSCLCTDEAHTDTCPEPALVCTQPEHTHADSCFQPPEDKLFTYTGDTVTVTVTLAPDSAVPADAVLQVTPIDSQSSQYTQLAAQAAEAVAGELAYLRLYDISFYTADGTYYAVEDTAQVTIGLPESREGDFTVLHYTDAEPVPVADLAVTSHTDGTDLDFTTDGFSVYAVVQVTGTAEATTEYVATLQQITAASQVSGQSFAIVSPGGYAMAATLSAGTDIAESPGSAALWTFQANGNGYRLLTGTGTYLRYSNGLTTTTTANQATTFTLTVNSDGTVSLSCRSGRSTYYITASGSSFSAATGTATHLSLYTVQEQTVETETPEGEYPLTGLDGKSFVIANINTSARTYAMQASQITSGSATGLEGVEISLTDGGTNGYIVYDDGDLTLWTFTATDTAGVYYIHADGQYLTINAANSVTLSTAPQAITLTAGTAYAGQVKLSSGNITLDWFGAAAVNGNIFSGYAGDGKNNYQVLAELVDLSGAIIYELNEPFASTNSGRWADGYTVALTGDAITKVAAMTALQSKPTGWEAQPGPAGLAWAEQNPDAEDNPYCGLYRMYSQISDTVIHDNRALLEELGCGYTEFAFDGWVYTAADGTACLLAPDSPVTADSTGFTVTPIGIITADGGLAAYTGDPITVPAGSVLQGHWTEVSAPVYFFINYTGTILDTEGDVQGRNQRDFLEGAAFGRVFYGKLKVGTDGSYANQAHEEISALFTDILNLDLDSRQTQLVIYAATDYNGSLLIPTTEHDESYAEANSRIIMEAVLSWIHEDSSLTIKLSTGNGETTVNNDLATTDNYSVRWYVLKEQFDGWHIDGVVTAVTQTLTVTKSFEGLTAEQTTALLDGYHIDLWIRGNTADQKYMILQDLRQLDDSELEELMGVYHDYGTYQEVDGQYTFQYDETTQTASWTVRLLSQEHVTLQEYSYTLDGYTVTPYSVIDARPETVGGVLTGYDLGDSTRDVVGGVTGQVAFSNVYTQVGTGTASFLKQNTISGILMQDVEFTLTDSSGQAVEVQRTDQSGWVHFMNLTAGTYTLTETGPPQGYTPADPLTVEITEDGGVMTVAILDSGGTELARGSPIAQLILENIPDRTTVVLEKDFSGITPQELANMPDYCITVSDSGGVLFTCTLDNADYSSADGLHYSWTLPDIGYRQLEIAEYSFASPAHIDVQVAAQLYTEGETSDLEVSVNRDNTLATVQLHTGTAAARITLTNTYTNEFELFLAKVDTITQEPLAGAVFALYGTYEESTDTRNTVRYYMDAAHTQVGTLYYIGTTEPSDENGLARVTGLLLSQTGRTYAYVLSEIQAPTGYVLPQYDIIPHNQVVMVTLGDLENNVFSTEVVNQVQGETLRVEKQTQLSGSYSLDITLSAPAPTVRYNNRQYTYHVYDSGGVLQLTATVKGTAAYNAPDAQTLEETLDSVTFRVQLEPGWYVEVEDVPVGYRYYVQEADGSYYTAMVAANGTGAYYSTLRALEGTVVAAADNTVTVHNYATPAEATASVTVTKVWSGGAADARPQVNIRLYDSSGTLVDTVTLTQTLGWTYTWQALPLYDDTGQPLDYYVAEQALDNYITAYSRGVTLLTLPDGTLTVAAHATGTAVTVTNTYGAPALPATGGSGLLPVMLTGLVLLLAPPVLWLTCRRKRKRLSG